MALVAVVGRPNVGKSTLINRIIGRREAIVQAEPGVTRDRKYLKADWNGRTFTLVDTGGLEFDETAGLTKKIRDQALFAIREADAILFIVDAKDGLLGQDEDVADILRRTEKPVILVVNKWDDPGQPPHETIFYKLGLGDPFPVSAAHGIGIGDLLDVVTSLLPDEKPEDKPAARLAIVGRPNVGKSSILNRLLEQERAIVSEMAGTTRDSIDSKIVKGGKTYLVVDTAGLRKKSKVTDDVEYYSSLRVIEALERSEVALLVIDAGEGVTEQDQHIAADIAKRGRACIILINKWDLIKGESAEEVLKDMKERLHFVSYAPVVTVSALSGRSLGKIFDLVDEVIDAYRDRIPTSDLNKFVEDNKRSLEGSDRGKSWRVLYGTQATIEPPTIVFFLSARRTAGLVSKRFRRTVENRLRESFDFTGSPIRLRFRAKERKTK
ncbi:MAG: ribosome biogenesis GTPase Der [Actinomycetota bacterium]